MTKKDAQLLEEAYLSITKKSPSVPSDEQNEISLQPNKQVSVGSMDEPAPGVDVEMVEPEANPSTEAAVEITSAEEDEGHCPCEENEEIDMAIDNLNSIRESIMKIAAHCGSGGHLETWAQQKLAIAMDNLAGVARSLH